LPYAPQFLADFARTVSRVRLFRYLVAADQDFELALSLYEKNVLLSQAVFGFLHGLEVAVRNSIHHVLSQDLNKINWIKNHLQLPWPDPAPSHLDFTQPMLEMLTQAHRKIGTTASVGKLIAELNFGFWVDLIGARYDHIWRNSLHKAFPHAHVPRKIVHWRLESIRHLRNRIAHHEPIITSTNTVCTGRFDETHITLGALVECVNWVSPSTADWLTATTHIGQAEHILNSVAAMDLTL
jgi:hypothetical protein